MENIPKPKMEQHPTSPEQMEEVFVDVAAREAALAEGENGIVLDAKFMEAGTRVALGGGDAERGRASVEAWRAVQKSTEA